MTRRARARIAARRRGRGRRAAARVSARQPPSPRASSARTPATAAAAAAATAEPASSAPSSARTHHHRTTTPRPPTAGAPRSKPYCARPVRPYTAHPAMAPSAAGGAHVPPPAPAPRHRQSTHRHPSNCRHRPIRHASAAGAPPAPSLLQTPSAVPTPVGGGGGAGGRAVAVAPGQLSAEERHQLMMATLADATPRSRPDPFFRQFGGGGGAGDGGGGDAELDELIGGGGGVAAARVATPRSVRPGTAPAGGRRRRDTGPAAVGGSRTAVQRHARRRGHVARRTRRSARVQAAAVGGAARAQVDGCGGRGRRLAGHPASNAASCTPTTPMRRGSSAVSAVSARGQRASSPTNAAGGGRPTDGPTRSSMYGGVRGRNPHTHTRRRSCPSCSSSARALDDKGGDVLGVVRRFMAAQANVATEVVEERRQVAPPLRVLAQHGGVARRAEPAHAPAAYDAAGAGRQPRQRVPLPGARDAGARRDVRGQLEWAERARPHQPRACASRPSTIAASKSTSGGAPSKRSARQSRNKSQARLLARAESSRANSGRGRGRRRPAAVRRPSVDPNAAARAAPDWRLAPAASARATGRNLRRETRNGAERSCVKCDALI